MKVKIEFTIHVDADGWATEYGIDRTDVRDDVKSHVHYLTLAQLKEMNLLDRTIHTH